MALLLAMYQKMRLIREKNQLVLDQTKVSSKLTRVQKNIERTQKYYTSLFTKLESEAKQRQNIANININNMFGFGSAQMGMNPYNYTGLSQNALMTMQQCLAGGSNNVTMSISEDDFNNGKYDSTIFEKAPDNMQPQNGSNILLVYKGMDQNLAQNLLNLYVNNGKIPEFLENGVQKIDPSLGPLYGTAGEFNQGHITAFNAAKTYATQQEQMMRTQCSNLQMSSQNNISIWLDAAKAELEAQQDAALEPLNYEETMLELEKETKDTRLKRIEEEINSYKQLCDNEIKNATPTFGLA